MTQQSCFKSQEIELSTGRINVERSDCMAVTHSCLCICQVSIGQVMSGFEVLIWKGKKISHVSPESNKEALESVPSHQGCVKALPCLF